MVADTTVTARPASSDRRVMLALMTTAYTLNFVDRTIVASIGQAIKTDLKITDTQLGLLGGLYFALLYTVLGIPLARVAERYSRVNTISAAIFVWSGFTALCGSAASYASLAVYRFGVGIGEAGLAPPAHSLLSDYYPPATAPIIVPMGLFAGGAHRRDDRRRRGRVAGAGLFVARRLYRAWAAGRSAGGDYQAARA